jgi:hypothetical protein
VLLGRLLQRAGREVLTPIITSPFFALPLLPPPRLAPSLSRIRSFFVDTECRCLLASLLLPSQLTPCRGFVLGLCVQVSALLAHNK